jgi:spore maturation protein CgeB
MIRGKSVRVPDFTGNFFSLPSNQEHYRKVAENGNDVLLLGVGPDAVELPFVKNALAQGKKIFWHQAPIFAKASLAPLHSDRFEIPHSWHKIENQDVPIVFNEASTYFYKPAMRVEPDYWGPLLGKLEGLFAKFANRSGRRVACLPGDRQQLMHLELGEALSKNGFDILEGDFSGSPDKFFSLPVKPDIFISTNLRGLDQEGRIFHYSQAQNIPLAIWMVDNPWHLLSSLRLPWWKDAAIFVTDASFIKDLRAAGARNVHFLPLAASPHMPGQAGAGSGAPVFVGRSEFPDKKKFFAAATCPADFMQAAKKFFAAGKMPDFHWWQENLKERLWPGFGCRRVGLGAEECSCFNRQRWLKAGVESGIEIYGDAGWQKLLPGAILHDPVDYYGKLPQIYAGALAVLNVTSLLLPQSLSQRHFDVWAANGFLLSDPTKGLDIFPHDLVGPIRVDGPEKLLEKLAWLESRPAYRSELSSAWREHILGCHLYSHRISRILEILG